MYYHVFISVIHFSAIPSYPQFSPWSSPWIVVEPGGSPPIENPEKKWRFGWHASDEFPDFILGVMAWRFLRPVSSFFGWGNLMYQRYLCSKEHFSEIVRLNLFYICSNGWIKKYSRHACSCPMSSWKWHGKKHSPITASAFFVHITAPSWAIKMCLTLISHLFDFAKF